MTRIGKASGTATVPLAGWHLLSTAAGSIRHPDSLPAAGWVSAVVPGTVAGTCRANASLDSSLLEPDQLDWWYRCQFMAEVPAASKAVLRLDGLATVAEVWLNGARILQSESMFIAHSVDVGAHLRNGQNELHILFLALAPLLNEASHRGSWR